MIRLDLLLGRCLLLEIPSVIKFAWRNIVLVEGFVDINCHLGLVLNAACGHFMVVHRVIFLI